MVREDIQLDPPSPDDPWMQRLLGERYHITAELGHGSASTVYRASDLQISGRQVALKVGRMDRLSIQTGRARAHLLHEAQALAALRHPALPSLYDVLVQEEHYALVLEYLPGLTLRQIAARKPVDEAELLDWALRLCDVLVYLHGHPSRPLIHGAIVAAHCMLMPEGRLVLFDFGTAEPVTDAGRWQDARAVAVLSAGLLGNIPGDGLSTSPATSSVDKATSRTSLQLLFQQAVSGELLTVPALRARLQKAAAEMSLPWGICQTCQARVRIQARYCGVCGATMQRESNHPAPQAAAEPTFEPSSPLTRVSNGASKTSAPRGVAELRLPAPAAGQSPSLSRLYAPRLRTVGRYLDHQRLRNVLVVESGTDFFIRGRTQGGTPGDVPLGTLASALLSADDLAALDKQALQYRMDNPMTPGRPPRGPAGSGFFVQGYESRLRALGVELDALGGVAQVSLIETSAGLYLDYDRTGDDLPTGIAHQHLLLSATNLDAMHKAAEARRRTYPLGDMIRRASIERLAQPGLYRLSTGGPQPMDEE